MIKFLLTIFLLSSSLLATASGSAPLSLDSDTTAATSADKWDSSSEDRDGDTALPISLTSTLTTDIALLAIPLVNFNDRHAVLNYSLIPRAPPFI